MADIPLGCVAYRYFNVQVDRPSLPNLESWYARLAQRPDYQNHVMRFFGTNPQQWQALEQACASEGIL
jgi:glutathione S-transferase